MVDRDLWTPANANGIGIEPLQSVQAFSHSQQIPTRSKIKSELDFSTKHRLHLKVLCTPLILHSHLL